jgi:hypothetical protein
VRLSTNRRTGQTQTLGTICGCIKAVLMLGAGDKAVALFYAYIGRPNLLHQQSFCKKP